MCENKCDTHRQYTYSALRDEKESGCGPGDGFNILLVVTAIVTPQQEVEDAHDAHQEQEGDDTFAKQVAGGAEKESDVLDGKQ